MATITLTNEFHNTSVRVRLPESGVLSAAVSERVRRTLCPVAGCTCGAVRGHQFLLARGTIVDDGHLHQDRIAIVEK
jgi:hypothetical protein